MPANYSDPARLPGMDLYNVKRHPGEPYRQSVRVKAELEKSPRTICVAHIA